MPQLNTYLRTSLDKPLNGYCKEHDIGRGTLINNMLEKLLKKEGYL